MVTGELYLAGAGVTRGYSGRSGLTAPWFVACLFGAPGGGCTAPATSCAGTWTGRLVFLGRADDQMKLRGFRLSG